MTDNPIILLVEDDVDLNNMNRRALESKKYTVHTALTLAEARMKLKETKPDVILLDVMLPDGSGFDFCAEIRGKTDAYILYLTAKTDHESMVKGLMAGGDDYIVKPFLALELLARVDSSLRRRKVVLPAVNPDGAAIVLHVYSKMASIDGVDLALTSKEFDLFLVFASNKDETLDAGFIYEMAWKQPMSGDKGTLQKNISNLRKKIEHTGYDIVSKRGEGYMLTVL